MLHGRVGGAARRRLVVVAGRGAGPATSSTGRASRATTALLRGDEPGRRRTSRAPPRRCCATRRSSCCCSRTRRCSTTSSGRVEPVAGDRRARSRTCARSRAPTRRRCCSTAPAAAGRVRLVVGASRVLGVHLGAEHDRPRRDRAVTARDGNVWAAIADLAAEEGIPRTGRGAGGVTCQLPASETGRAGRRDAPATLRAAAGLARRRRRARAGAGGAHDVVAAGVGAAGDGDLARRRARRRGDDHAVPAARRGGRRRSAARPRSTVDFAGRSRGGLAVLAGAAGQTTAEATCAVAAVHGGRLERPFGVTAARGAGHRRAPGRRRGARPQPRDARGPPGRGGRERRRRQRAWPSWRARRSPRTAAGRRCAGTATRPRRRSPGCSTRRPLHHALVAVDLGMLDGDQLAAVVGARSHLHVWVAAGPAGVARDRRATAPADRLRTAGRRGDRRLAGRRAAALGQAAVGARRPARLPGGARRPPRRPALGCSRRACTAA